MPLILPVNPSGYKVYQSCVAFSQLVQSFANQQGNEGLCFKEEMSDDLMLRLSDCCIPGQCSRASLAISWEDMFGSTSSMSIGQLLTQQIGERPAALLSALHEPV
jgi:hypothetical protein